MLIRKEALQRMLEEAEERGYLRAKNEYQQILERALEEQRLLYELRMDILKKNLTLLSDEDARKLRELESASLLKSQARQLVLLAQHVNNKINSRYKEYLNGSYKKEEQK